MFTKARTVTALFFISVAACLAVSLGTASPAGATMRVCSDPICVAPLNSCWLTVPGKGELIFDEGDTIISAFGQKLRCKGGEWVPAAAVPTSSVLAPGPGQILPGH